MSGAISYNFGAWGKYAYWMFEVVNDMTLARKSAVRARVREPVLRVTMVSTHRGEHGSRERGRTCRKRMEDGPERPLDAWP
jgi:hypothetical protein